MIGDPDCPWCRGSGKRPWPIAAPEASQWMRVCECAVISRPKILPSRPAQLTDDDNENTPGER